MSSHRLIPHACVLFVAACLPKHSHPPAGQHAVLPALEAGVRVEIDTQGIPHIDAATRDDAAAALGFLHVRDRGFQLELIRLASQGRLTEIFGADLLEVDKRLRLLTWRLEAWSHNLPPTDRARIEAYCAGVNAGLANAPTPLELKLLGHVPEPWGRDDVLAVARLQAWQLTWDAEAEAVRHRIRGVIEEDWLFELLTAPTPDLGAAIQAPDPSAWPAMGSHADPQPGASLRQADAVPIRPGKHVRGSVSAEAARDVETRGGGSNAWVVSGDLTEDGRPLLAGDPHLGLGWPPVFYEAHVRTAEAGSVHGATFPGLPMVVIGRSDTAIWSLTTSYLDQQDLLELEVSADGASYMVDGKAMPLVPRTERFVLDADKGEVHEETYLSTHWGPVYNHGRESTLRADSTYALRWSGYDVPRAEGLSMASTFDAVHAATSADEMVAAVVGLPVPSQNWIFATINGDIGWVLGGDMPRAVPSPLPLDGSTAHPPSPLLPESQRPSLINPDRGWVVGTNQPPGVHPQSGLTAAGTYFSGNWRALRATEVLHTNTARWTPERARGLQIDTVNLEAAWLTPLLLQSLPPVSPADSVLATAVAALREWDGNYQMSKDSVAPLIYEHWRGALHRRLARRAFPDDADLQAIWLRGRHSEAALLTALRDGAPPELWDDPRTPEVETQQAQIIGALADAISMLTDRHGSQVHRWTWGAQHQLVLDHPFASKAILRPWFGIDAIPMDGGRHVLYAMDHLGVVGDFTTEDGPALRQVGSPGAAGGFVLPGGNAGQPQHPYALNQLDDWMVNRQHESNLSEQDVTALTITATLFLEPN